MEVAAQGTFKLGGMLAGHTTLRALPGWSPTPGTSWESVPLQATNQTIKQLPSPFSNMQRQLHGKIEVAFAFSVLKQTEATRIVWVEKLVP